MEKSNKYTVAGHTFEVFLPDGYSKEEYLSPYSPFEVAGADVEPLFRLSLKVTDELRALNPGKVRHCLNEEAPYFWIFEPEDAPGRFNFGFSYSKTHPDCILMPSDDYCDNTVYIPSAYAERLAEFALSNSMMLLYTFKTTPLDTLMVHASFSDEAGQAKVRTAVSGLRTLPVRGSLTMTILS